MNKKLYVGNLPFSTTEEALTSFFSAAGTVESAKIITDRESGRSKGFAFVEMSSDTEAQAAVEKFNGQMFDGRNLKVSEAKPMEKREGGFGGGRGGGGRGPSRGPRSGGGGFRRDEY